MQFLNTLKSLFSSDGRQESNAQSEHYQGYDITATPMAEGSQYRICGTITKGERTHQFIRADQLPGQDLCVQETFRKAKLLIDQQGDSLFD